VRLSIKPALGKVVLTKLTAQHVQQLYTRMLAEECATNNNEAPYPLRKAPMTLCGWICTRNIASLVTPPKAAHEEMETYTPEEAIRFLESAKGDRLEALYVLMLTTACRLGELLGLRWEVLDLDRAEVRITSALKESSFSRRALGAPKTPHSRRTIPLTPRAVEALREHHVRQTVERIKFGGGWNPKGLVFCSTVGTPLSFDNFRNRDYTLLIERAKLKYIRPHNRRHTAATSCCSKRCR
jgi:integrase